MPIRVAGVRIGSGMCVIGIWMPLVCFRWNPLSSLYSAVHDLLRDWREKGHRRGLGVPQGRLKSGRMSGVSATTYMGKTAEARGKATRINKGMDTSHICHPLVMASLGEY